MKFIIQGGTIIGRYAYILISPFKTSLIFLMLYANWRSQGQVFLQFGEVFKPSAKTEICQGSLFLNTVLLCSSGLHNYGVAPLTPSGLGATCFGHAFFPHEMLPQLCLVQMKPSTMKRVPLHRHSPLELSLAWNSPSFSLLDHTLNILFFSAEWRDYRKTLMENLLAEFIAFSLSTLFLG